MRTRLAILTAVATMFVAGAAAAHDEYAVTGKITAVSAGAIQVAATNGQSSKLKLDKDTRVMSGAKKVTAKELKVGQSVEAIGIGDSRTDLVAIDVVIQAPKG